MADNELATIAQRRAFVEDQPYMRRGIHEKSCTSVDVDRSLRHGRR